DGTAARAAAAGASAVLRMSPRAGKGAALRVGFAAALAEGAEMVATLDADGQHDPADLPRLLAAGCSAPDGLIVGDRLGPGSGDRVPGLRRGAIRTADAVLRWLARTAIRDSQCGFRVYPAPLLQALPLRPVGGVAGGRPGRCRAPPAGGTGGSRCPCARSIRGVGPAASGRWPTGRGSAGIWRAR